MALPDRTPDQIGTHLQQDLRMCADSLSVARETLKQRIERPTSPAAQRQAIAELQAAELLETDPFFGYLAVQEDGTSRQYRIGRASNARLRIVDWRHPLARLFYEDAPGDEYGRPGGQGEILGTVTARARVVHETLELREASWEDADGQLTILRSDRGFVDEEQRVGPRVSSTEGLGDILAYITPEQWDLITGASDSPLIIQGKAGSGKTTVALHRLAYLTYQPDQGLEETDSGTAPCEDQEPRKIDPANVLVVMFNRALCQFVNTSLADLDLQAARLETFHAWAFGTVKDVYRGKLQISQSPLGGSETAARLKARAGVLDAIEAYVEGQTARMSGWLERKLQPYDPAWFRRWQAGGATADGEAQTAVVPRLVALRRQALKARDNAGSDRERQKLEQVYRIFRHAVQRMTLYKEDLRRILTDEALMAKHLSGDSAEDIAVLAAYQDQRQREGAPESRVVGHTVDFDDLALLLRIMQLKHGGLPTRDEGVYRFDHLVIDEAQDFGAVELTVLLDAVKSRTGVTIVGDLNQKIVPGAKFIGWDNVARELGIAGANVARLEVGHRSTAPIVALCDAIVGEPTRDAEGRSGPSPRAVQTRDPEETLSEVARLVDARLGERPDVHIAVVTRHKRTADQVVDRLSQALPGWAPSIRRGHNRDFVFESGVTVTNLRQVKGLEFDTVILLEADEEGYPDTTQGRRNFYVVASRAQERLFVVGEDLSSPILQALMDAGLIEAEQTAVPEVVLEDGDEPF